MQYTFSGGPLDGQTLNVDKLNPEGKYTHIEWGEYSDPLALLPAMTLHQYLPIDGTMHWIEPDKIVG